MCQPLDFQVFSDENIKLRPGFSQFLSGSLVTHLCFSFWYISLVSSMKQRREISLNYPVEDISA